MAGITLVQLAQVSKDPVKKYFGFQLIRESDILKLIPWENVSGLSIKAYWWETLPTGGAFRSLNEGYTAVQDGQLGDGNEMLAIFGGDIVYDKVLELIKDVVGDPVQLQIDARLKSMAIDFNYNFINGDTAVTPKGFNGLKKRVAAMPTRQTVYAAASSGASLDYTASAANARKYLNKFNATKLYCNGGKPDAFLMNENSILGFSQVLSLIQGSGNYLKTTEDQFGREEVSYRGIPFIDPGLKQDQSTEIIPETELSGAAAADSTSIYAVAFNMDNGVHGVQLNEFNAYKVAGGNELEDTPQKKYRIDWVNGIASFGRNGITRMRNIKGLAGTTEGA